MSGHDYDVLVIGSGFGGSASALSLSEKGYKVGVLEDGRRWIDKEIAGSHWNLRNSNWAPALRHTGTQRIHGIGTVTVFSGAGVGGGRHIYGNPRTETHTI